MAVPNRWPTPKVKGGQEAWLRLLMLALILTTMPVTAIGCGLVANRVLGHQARVQERSDSA
jgi:hypothetical protein